VCPCNAVVVVVAFPPVALHAFTGTTPPSDFLSRFSCSRFIITCSTYSLSLKDVSGSPESPIIPNGQHAMLYNPEAALYYLSFAAYNGGFQEGKPVALLVWKLTRLNHFSLRLRPVALRTSCLTFGVASACPMLATRWLTCLAGTGVSPAGIIDLARPHPPLIIFCSDIALLSQIASKNYAL